MISILSRQPRMRPVPKRQLNGGMSIQPSLRDYPGWFSFTQDCVLG
jgi:hypothetical protein